jgi:hypothetical protein
VFVFDRGREFGFVRGRCRRRTHFGQSEIENLRVSAFRNEDVCGLYVTMHYTFGMRSIQGIRDFDRKREKRIHLKRPAGNAVLECHSLEIFHHDERLAIVLADFVDSADVWMIERRSCSRFPAKSLKGLPVRRYTLGKKLESDEASELGVFRLINNAHPAAAEFLNNSVVGYGRAEHGY